MGVWPDEEIVHRKHFLTIIGGGFGHGYHFDIAVVIEGLGQNLVKLLCLIWQQDSVPSAGIGIHADELLTVKIFHGIADKAVSPQGHDHIILTKEHIWNKILIDNREPCVLVGNLFRRIHSPSVNLILRDIIGKISPHMLDVELGLLSCVVFVQQFL